MKSGITEVRRSWNLDIYYNRRMKKIKKMAADWPLFKNPSGDGWQGRAVCRKYEEMPT